MQSLQKPVLQLPGHVFIAQRSRRMDRFFVRLQEGHTVDTAFQMPCQDQGSYRIKCASDVIQQQRCGLFTRDKDAP